MVGYINNRVGDSVLVKCNFSVILGIWHCKGFRQGSFSIKMVFLDSVYEFLVKKKLDCLLKMHFEHASAIG